MKQQDLTFGDKLRPKNWEELIVLQINRCLEDLRTGKDQFVNSVSGLMYMTMFLQNEEFLKEMKKIDKEIEEESRKLSPYDKDKRANKEIDGVLKQFGEIIKMLNNAGIKPVPYGSLVVE